MRVRSTRVEPIRRQLHRVTAFGAHRPKTLVSHFLQRCGRSIFARIRFPEHRQGSGRPTSSAFDRRRETERSLAPDRRQELLPAAVIASHVRKSLSVIEFRQVRRQPVSAFNSCVNSAPQRKLASPQWDSRARPAKRQHQRCIGCEKRPCWICLVFGLRLSSVKTLRRSWVWPIFVP